MRFTRAVVAVWVHPLGNRARRWRRLRRRGLRVTLGWTTAELRGTLSVFDAHILDDVGAAVLPSLASISRLAGIC